MVLETYILVDNKTKAYEMANKLAKDLSSNRYMSTQTTAFGLYAMSKLHLKWWKRRKHDLYNSWKIGNRDF